MDLFRDANHVSGLVDNKILHIEITSITIDIFNYKEIFGGIERILHNRQSDYLIIDMKNITTLSSSGMGYLITMHSSLKGNMYLYNVDSEVLKQFRYTCLDSYLNVSKSLENVLSTINGGRSARPE